MFISKIYSPKFQLIIRLFSLIAVIILVVSNAYMFFSQKIFFDFTKNIEAVFTFFCNLFSIICFIIVALFPVKIGFFSLISFLYSFVILVFEPENPMGIFMYCLGITSLMVRGFFKKHQKVKFISFFFIFLIVLLSELRFGIDFFCDYLIDKVGYFFVLTLIVFFSYVYLIDFSELNVSVKKLDIKVYPNLQLRDAKWLAYILNNKKYQWLAIEYNISLGTVKNRMKMIFNTLGVGDKRGFYNKYSDFEISYGDEFSSNDTNQFFGV